MARRAHKRGRALRRRYGRHGERELRSAYGTHVDGARIRDEHGETLVTFGSGTDAAQAWEIIAAFEGKWGDSASTFDGATWRHIGTILQGRGLKSSHLPRGW